MRADALPVELLFPFTPVSAAGSIIDISPSLHVQNIGLLLLSLGERICRADVEETLRLAFGRSENCDSNEPCQPGFLENWNAR